MLVGHRDGDHRPKIPQLHAQLSKFDPALRKTSHWNCRALESVQFDTIYGHYFDRVIPTGGKQILGSSVKRYVAAVGGAYNNE